MGNLPWWALHGIESVECSPVDSLQQTNQQPRFSRPSTLDTKEQLLEVRLCLRDTHFSARLHWANLSVVDNKVPRGRVLIKSDVCRAKEAERC